MGIAKDTFSTKRAIFQFRKWTSEGTKVQSVALSQINVRAKLEPGSFSRMHPRRITDGVQKIDICSRNNSIFPCLFCWFSRSLARIVSRSARISNSLADNLKYIFSRFQTLACFRNVALSLPCHDWNTEPVLFGFVCFLLTLRSGHSSIKNSGPLGRLRGYTAIRA